jgi:predicted TIM-barrel fold metal-dependent hydrolase
MIQEVNPAGAEPAPLVIDLDAHYYEQPREWARFLDEPWRTRIAAWSADYYAPIEALGRTADAHLQGRIDHDQLPELHQPDDVPRAMDYLGIDCMVLLPNALLALNHISDRRRALVLCRGYVEHMLERVVDPARGIFTTLCLAPHDPLESARLVERYGAADGVCSVCLMTDGPLPFPFGDQYYDPIYRAVAESGLPLLFHSGFGGPEGGFSGLGLQSYVENHLAFVVNQQVQITSVVMQGVPERHPELKLVWEEAGIFWIPGLMYRLDTEYSRRRSDHTLLRKPPSEYVKGFWFTTQPLEVVPKPEYFRYVLEMIDGQRTLVFASDWPHSDFDHPSAVAQSLGFLSRQERQQILGGNAARLLRLRGFEAAGRLAAAGKGG